MCVVSLSVHDVTGTVAHFTGAVPPTPALLSSSSSLLPSSSSHGILVSLLYIFTSSLSVFNCMQSVLMGSLVKTVHFAVCVRYDKLYDFSAILRLVTNFVPLFFFVFILGILALALGAECSARRPCGVCTFFSIFYFAGKMTYLRHSQCVAFLFIFFCHHLRSFNFLLLFCSSNLMSEDKKMIL